MPLQFPVFGSINPDQDGCDSRKWWRKRRLGGLGVGGEGGVQREARQRGEWVESAREAVDNE